QGWPPGKRTRHGAGRRTKGVTLLRRLTCNISQGFRTCQVSHRTERVGRASISVRAEYYAPPRLGAQGARCGALLPTAKGNLDARSEVSSALVREGRDDLRAIGILQRMLASRVEGTPAGRVRGRRHV